MQTSLNLLLTHGGGCNINFNIVQDAGLAQSVEQRTENPRVRGSIPRPGTLITKIGQFRLPYFFIPAFVGQARRQTMFISLIIKGGIVMIPIILGSIVALAIILERFWTLWRIRLNFQQFAQEIFLYLERGQFKKALERCEKVKHPIA